MCYTCNILQWNCEGLKAKFTAGDIHQLIKETNSTVLCLQETKLPHGKFFKIKGYKTYLNSLKVEEDENPHGGVAIFVKNFASSYGIDLDTPLQAVAVSVKIKRRITVCSLYLPPNQVIPSEQLQHLIDQLPKPFMLLGDFNAHHSMWHDPREIDARGKTIVDLIAQNDIALLDGNKMTSIWKVDKSFSHIDLSLCSTELLSVFHWDVNDEPLNSDHFPIFLRSDNPVTAGGPKKWLLEKADWHQYKADTESNQNVAEFDSVDDAAAFFESHIKEAASKSIPRSSGSGNRRSPPWWNRTCREAISKRKAKFRKYRRDTTGSNYNIFSKARAEARREVKASKKEAWQDLIDSINSKSTSRDIWKKINMLNNKYKSEIANTLILNKKEVRISNIPEDYRMHLIKDLCTLGCLQTINFEDDNNPGTVVRVRFESDDATEKALELDSTVVQGSIIKVELLLHDDHGGKLPKVLDDPKDIADCLARRFAYVSSKSSGDARFKDQKIQAEREHLNFSSPIKHGYNEQLTSDELDYALRLASDSAPGPDDICYSMLKNLAPSGKKLLLDLLNSIFKGGKFPDRYKEAFIIPILKQGKAATAASSYRPIALTSCISKLLERIVNRRLVWYLESKGLIDKCQSGFRRGRSTVDCLASLATEAHDAFRRGQYLFCIFFDLEKAYDTCWKWLIMKQLHTFGLRGALPTLIENFLSDRAFRVRLGTHFSAAYEQEMGVPQGGVLSCTLFNIAINTVVEVIRGDVSYSIYVDDKRISFAGTSADFCRKRLQQVLDSLQRWALRTGFRFSTLKTEWMVFYRNIKEPRGIRFTLDGKPLKQVTSKKFLGLIFDRMLNWELHIEYLRGKCLKAMNILYMISRGNKEITSEVLLRIYRALIRPILEYGCEVYGTAPSGQLLKLDPIHHKGLRICLVAYRTSPIESLYVLADELSLTRRRQMLQMHYYVRLKQFLPHNLPIRLDNKFMDGEYSRQNTNKPIALGFSVRQTISKLKVDVPTVALLTESVLGPWERKSPTICLHLSQFSKETTTDAEFLCSFLEHKHHADVDIYTDGSKSSTAVGAGVVISSKETGTSKIKRRLHITASIFTAELYAIKLALLSLKTSRNISSTIYTDSLSAAQAIKGQSQCRLVLDIFELVVALQKRNITVNICWLPGHVGILGNELADKTAKSALDLTAISTQEIPASDVKSYIKRIVREAWSCEWDEQTVWDFKVKEIFPHIRKSTLDLGLTRKDAWKMTRLQIGHSRLTHANIFEREEPARCVRCGRGLSIRHILYECDNMRQERLLHFDPRAVSYQSLLTSREWAIKVLQFLKALGIYDNI